ncbi:MAG: P22 phage major capsid protein family protein [Nitrosomonadaceae bacterium]
MIKKFLKTLSYVAFDNDFDTDERAWNPEIWAAETLAVLEENMVIGRLVHTDFSNVIASFGDTVNTRKPGTFTAKRKGTNDDVDVQNATAVKVPVVLNQHVHTSFMIRDGEESRSFRDLIDEYLRPAAKSLAEHIDRILLGQVFQFLDNQIEIDPDDTSSDIKDAILDTREVQNVKKVPMDGRNLILTPATETEALKLDLFLSAEKVGDSGTALREASLGKKLGYETFMSQNASGYATDGGSTLGTTNAAGSTNGVMAKGATTITLTSDSSAILAGMYITFTTVAGVYRVLTGANATTITIDRGLEAAMPDDSFVRYYTVGAVDLAGHSGVSTYPIGYDKQINIAASGVIPQLGQLVGFGDSDSDPVRTGEYAIIDVATGSGAGDYYIMLDRPLEAALEDTDVVNYGPPFQYNFAFDRAALALVTRPLAMPRSGTGAVSGVSSYNDLSMRVTITYNGTAQGHLVTLDMLCGVKVLDEDRGAVMLRGRV